MTKDEATKDDAVKLFHHGQYFRVSTSERTCLSAKPVWAAPLSRPGKYLALLDEAGEQIVMVEDPESLPAESQAALEK